MLENLNPRVIAEIGVNHNGSYKFAADLVRAAAGAGADTAKFQIFDVEKLVSPNTKTVAYQNKNSGTKSQNELLENLTLSRAEFASLQDLCRTLNIDFLATPFDLDSLYFLLEDLGQTEIKLGSGDLTNLPLIYEVGLRRAKLILSTGMANVEEIWLALAAYQHGYWGTDRKALSSEVLKATAAKENTADIQSLVVLMHCTSAYPAPFSSLNLNAIEKMRTIFNLRIGYSDHSLGIQAAHLAFAKGATVIEKHITLDRSLPGPDHAASSEPTEFAELINGLSAATEMLGSFEKQCTSVEVETKELARRGLHHATDVAAGENLVLEVLRPENGLSPLYYWDFQGKPSTEAGRAGKPFYG
jgi:sialic acid synthase SpsE